MLALTRSRSQYLVWILIFCRIISKTYNAAVKVAPKQANTNNKAKRGPFVPKKKTFILIAEYCFAGMLLPTEILWMSQEASHYSSRSYRPLWWMVCFSAQYNGLSLTIKAICRMNVCCGALRKWKPCRGNDASRHIFLSNYCRANQCR